MLLVKNLPIEFNDFPGSPCSKKATELRGSFKLLKKFNIPFSAMSGVTVLYVETIGCIAISSTITLNLRIDLFTFSKGS